MGRIIFETSAAKPSVDFIMAVQRNATFAETEVRTGERLTRITVEDDKE